MPLSEIVTQLKSIAGFRMPTPPAWIAHPPFISGEAAALEVLRFGRRLAGVRGENAVRLAGQAIRGVAPYTLLRAWIADVGLAP